MKLAADPLKSRPWLSVALCAIPPGCCHWPEAEIDDEAGFRFCCEAVAARPPPFVGDGSGIFPDLATLPPYCERHWKRAYLRDGETQEDRDRAERTVAREKKNASTP